MDDTITGTNPSVSNIISKLELALEVRALPSLFIDQTTSRIIANCEEYEGTRFRTGSPLACGVMAFACSSFYLTGSILYFPFN